MGNGNNPYWGDGIRHAHEGWWGGPLHLLVFLVIVALLVAGGVWLVRRLSRGSLAIAAAGPATIPAAVIASDPAVAALRMRYASGNVSREEFQQAMQDLTGQAVEPPGGEQGATPTSS